MTVVGVVVLVVCALIAAWLADRKGEPNVPGWFILGLIIGPFAIGLALIYSSPEPEEEEAEAE